jgi:tRNA-specific 2-thiouridylase
MKALVAMSGGVDSSVAAALLVEEGHDVIGVTLKLWEGPNGEAPTAGCCTVSDSEDARRVAAQLDIPYYVLDYTEDFQAGVVERFVGEYLAGWTPNPCVDCNRTVKFARLLGQAAELGCDLLVTGHYARVDSNGRYRLLRAADRSKDQSYVLYMLGQDELARVRFPLGEIEKDETRRIAARLSLRTANKPESQDICFVGRGNYRNFIERYSPSRPGDILDLDGRVVGHHDGVAGFTIGQRKGLGLAVGEPRYVIGLDAETATVVLGSKEDLLVASIEVGDVSWVAGQAPAGRDVEVKVRYHGEAVAARFEERADHLLATFEHAQKAVAPGQAAVFYEGHEVLGGGTIIASSR